MIIGDNPEQQLERYQELDLPEAELAQDSRAEFLAVFPAASLPAVARRFLAEAEANFPERAERYRTLIDEGRHLDVLEEHHGGQVGPEGDWGYYANPDGRWDWYQFGGRFSGLLRLIPGRKGITGERSWTNADEPASPATCDQACCGDIDWLATRLAFTPFAVISDGVWYEQGESGIWSATPNPEADAAWEREVDGFLEGLWPETLISVYDCHI